MVTRELLESKRPAPPWSTLRVARSCASPESIDVLRRRPDLWAVLDDVVLTPHIAGSLGAERRRLGRLVVSELRRFLAGKPLRWEIAAKLMASP